ESRFRCELFDSQRNVLDPDERPLRDRPFYISQVHEIQQCRVFDVQVAPIDSIGPRTIISCQRDRFTKRLDKSLYRVARSSQQVARNREIHTGTDIEPQALI